MAKTSLRVFWDGIYNIAPDGRVIAPGGLDERPDYGCNRFLVAALNLAQGAAADLPSSSSSEVVLAPLSSFESESVDSITTLVPPPIAVRVGRRSGAGAWRGVATQFIPYDEATIQGYAASMTNRFIPYEGLLDIPVLIDNIEHVGTLLIRVFRGASDPRAPQPPQDDVRWERDRVHLVYQEVLDRAALRALEQLPEGWREPVGLKRERTRRYAGIECFANWYHYDYTVEIWAAVDDGWFHGCDGKGHPLEVPGAVVHNHSVGGAEDELDLEHAAWSGYRDAAQCSRYGYNRIVAADVINQMFHRERNSPARFRLLDDFGRLQRFLRNQEHVVRHMQHLEDYLAAKPGASLVEALEYHERIVSFPTTQVIPLSVLPEADFLNLNAHAYPLDDLGAGATHGVYTHRLQWTALASHVTNRFTVGRREGVFYHTPLRLLVASGAPDMVPSPEVEGSVTRFDFNFPLFQWLCDRPGDTPDAIRLFHREESVLGFWHHPDIFHFQFLTGDLDGSGLENAIRAFADTDYPADPYRFDVRAASAGRASSSNEPIDTNLAAPRGTRGHFWLGRFVDRLSWQVRANPRYALPNGQELFSAVVNILDPRRLEFPDEEAGEKLVGLLSDGELRAEVAAFAEAIQANPPYPHLSARLMAIWLELRIAIYASNRALGTVLADRRDLVRIVQAPPVPRDIGSWVLAYLKQSDVDYIVGANKNLVDVVILWPWATMLRESTREANPPFVFMRTSVPGSDALIDALMPRGAVPLTPDDIAARMAASEQLVAPPPPAGFVPITIPIFEGSIFQWSRLRDARFGGPGGPA